MEEQESGKPQNGRHHDSKGHLRVLYKSTYEIATQVHGQVGKVHEPGLGEDKRAPDVHSSKLIRFSGPKVIQGLKYNDTAFAVRVHVAAAISRAIQLLDSKGSILSDQLLARARRWLPHPVMSPEIFCWRTHFLTVRTIGNAGVA